MVIFIVTAAIVIKCTLSFQVMHSYCGLIGFKEFGIVAAMGVLELIYEYKGIVGVFKQNNTPEKEEKEDKE